MKTKSGLRLRYSLHFLFVIMTLTAWMSWQWSVSEARDKTVRHLVSRYGYHVYRQSDFDREDRVLVCRDILFETREPQATRRSVVGTLIGYDNWPNLCLVMSSSHAFADGESMEAICSLDGLTTIVVYSINGKADRVPRVIDFKERLHERRPDIRIEYVAVSESDFFRGL